jgi:vacuolar-type H+-ATPase subunit I/STV1
MEQINYKDALLELQNLEREQSNFSSNLHDAAAAGNYPEVVKLKARASGLPHEIYAARIAVAAALVQQLRDSQISASSRLAIAKEESKKIDSRVASQLSVLNTERTKINDEAYSGLVAVESIKNEILKLDRELTDAQKKLSELLEIAA